MNETSDTAAAPIDNRVFVLILQHPQERRNTLATAELLVALLRHARLATGLSWPNLSQALGRRAEPGKWAVLYLGAARPAALGAAHEIVALDRHGAKMAEGPAALAGITGIVLLDGSWAEAKTLWWRNPWLLKLRRLVLNPAEAARYGRVRREPRREALSTLEAAALVLKHLEARPEIERLLLGRLDRLIAEAPPPSRRVHRQVRR
ncbi:MAG TPA: tRNA-uridine aminocarboxypropyltransferase [Stellaceae bacterium]|nr:tRNA-uridine aminocarboxypropyltransferase [Stellaceae bacterium]